MPLQDQNTTPTPSSIAVDLFALKILGTVVREGTADRKTVATATMKKGDSIAARVDVDGRDVKLGKVTMTDPKPVGRVTDRAALDEWLTKHVEGAVIERWAFGPDAEVAAVLNEHAPHLLTFVAEVAEWARAAALSKAEAAHRAGSKPLAPGIEVTVPDGVVSVGKETPEARAAVLSLIRQGVINVDAPLSIEGGAK
jgi:hypothetical protein